MPVLVGPLGFQPCASTPSRRTTAAASTSFESDFLQVPLSQPGDVCMASVMFLPPGAVIGRHEATMPQLLCVIDGSGFVSGSDGVEVSIEAFQAAFWEAGEDHETRTVTGMTTITLEGTDLQPFAPIEGTDPGRT